MLDSFLQDHPRLAPVVTGQLVHADLPAYYSLMDVFVHPSLRDGMPNAVLEAMACEKPVVASAVGGMLDVLKDEENGLLVPPGNAQALASAIVCALTDPELGKKLGRSARQTVIAGFSPRQELEGNLRMYRELGLEA